MPYTKSLGWGEGGGGIGVHSSMLETVEDFSLTLLVPKERTAIFDGSKLTLQK